MNENLDSDKIQAAVRYIDSWLELNFAHSHMPAMQVAIQHDDTLVYSRPFGYADTEKKTPLTKEHLFRVASHSKTFTATAIMQLVEDGKIQLDDEVSRYVEWFRSSRDARVARVTVRQLLNHTAGVIRDGTDADYWELQRPFPDMNELREYIADSILVYDADERFKYSNFAYGYLGAVIEAVSGVPYHAYVMQNSIDRLGLQSTSPDLGDETNGRLAMGYGVPRSTGRRPRFSHVSTQALAPATGFCSNAEDMCRYFAAHFHGNDALISDRSKRQMQHGYWWAGRGEYYGIGLIHYPRGGWDLYGHSGGLPGFATNTQFDPKRKLVVSVLTNAIDTLPKELCGHIINIISAFQQDEEPVADRSKFEGRFYSVWGPLDIVATGGSIHAIDPLGWSEFNAAEQLSVIDGSTLRIQDATGYSSLGETITFHFDNDQIATSISYAGRTLKSQIQTTEE